jgi:hypothetical protein
LIFDGALTAGLAAMVGLIVATFTHKDWTISGGWWDVFGVILLIGVIAAFQQFVHRNLDSMLTPDGESDDERIRSVRRVNSPAIRHTARSTSPCHALTVMPHQYGQYQYGQILLPRRCLEDQEGLTAFWRLGL